MPAGSGSFSESTSNASVCRRQSNVAQLSALNASSPGMVRLSNRRRLGTVSAS